MRTPSPRMFDDEAFTTVGVPPLLLALPTSTLNEGPATIADRSSLKMAHRWAGASYQTPTLWLL